MQHHTAGDSTLSDGGHRSSCSFPASPQGFSSVLQHYLLFFTTRFNALSLISTTHQHMPLQVCKGQTHRDQLYFWASLNMGTMRQGTWTKRNGNKTYLLFSQQGNQSFGLETFSCFCKESCPSVLVTGLQFPNRCPISKGKPPNSTPCPRFPHVGNFPGCV